MTDDRKLTGYGELAEVLVSLPLILREMRRARGISLRKAAEEIGVGFTTLHRMENETSSFDVRTALAVMRWLDWAATP